MATTGTTIRGGLDGMGGRTAEISKQSKLTLHDHQKYLANCMTGRNTNLSHIEIDYDSIYKYSIDGN